VTARCIYREENVDSHLEIWEDGDRRSLWFDDAILQSEIHIHDPAVLPNPVNRMMLAHLMLELPLRSVLLAGCGGGAIARWFDARAPEIRGDAVERSATVARLAHEYFDFPSAQSNWRLLIEDVRDHLLHRTAAYDFILVDLEENQATPTWVSSVEFLGDCHRNLSHQGILTVNLINDDNRSASEALHRIRQVFESGVLLLSDPGHDNLVIHAFKSEAPGIPQQTLLDERGKRWGIDFSTLAQRTVNLPATA
jgi:SAM-dependent methyltransferase